MKKTTRTFSDMLNHFLELHQKKLDCPQNGWAH